MSKRPILRNLDLNLLVLFDAIMREKQLTEAANQVGITQSAASQALARMRHKFHDELFIRTRQGMLPTPTASSIAPAIREALFIVENVLKQTNDFDPSTSQREFCLAFGFSAGPSLLASILRTVGDNANSIKIKSLQGSAQSSLEATTRGEIDFFFDYSIPLYDKLNWVEIVQEEMVVIAKAQHPRISKSITKKQFFAERHIVLALPDEQRALVDSVLQDNGKRRQKIAEVNSYDAILPLISQTEAIATVPKSMVDIEIFDNLLQILKMPIDVPRLPLHLIWHSSLEADPAHQWLKNLIIEHIREQPNKRAN